MTKVENHSFATETRVVALAATLISLLAFLWFYTRGEILLYGDAVAHINIARRVFDSRSPGPLQLGTVWLPFPHVVTIPFIVNDWMWKTGVGGSIPSMIAYVLGTIGVFRLVRRRELRIGAWAAAAVYVLNPNLLYMQSTGMTESIFLATVVWAVVYAHEFVSCPAQPDAGSQGLANGDRCTKSLERCGMVLAAAILTRYDGWVLAGIIGVVVVLVDVRRWRAIGGDSRRRLLKSSIEFCLLCALTATLWLAQNYAISGNPLDFADGPYSAKAIEARTSTPGQPGHPGTGNLWVSAIFFLKAAKLNLAWSAWEQWAFLLLLAGTAIVVVRWKEFAPLLLLWFVLPFYAYSVAYGSVPIFMPVWWPHSYYNVRYGLELLPGFGVFVGVLIGWTWMWVRPKAGKWAVAGSGFVLVAGSYVAVARATPICLREARVNSVSRVALEKRLASELERVPKPATFLMFTSSYVGALQRAGIPLKRTVNESIHPEWDYAMADPAGYADYVVAVDGDPVAYAVKAFPQDLELVVRFETAGKPAASIYKSTRLAHSGGS